MKTLILVLILMVALIGVSSGMTCRQEQPMGVKNPYNPLLQPGRYTNYQINHPTATPMPKWLAELEV